MYSKRKMHQNGHFQKVCVLAVNVCRGVQIAEQFKILWDRYISQNSKTKNKKKFKNQITSICHFLSNATLFSNQISHSKKPDHHIRRRLKRLVRNKRTDGWICWYSWYLLGSRKPWTNRWKLDKEWFPFRIMKKHPMSKLHIDEGRNSLFSRL